MKKLVLFLLLLSSGFASAQLVQFGIKGGANFSNIESNERKYDFDTRTSYHFGALLEIRIFDNLSFQPEVLYSVQGAKVEKGISLDEVELKYVNVPMMLKFYLISDRLSLEAGPQFGFLTNDNLERKIETESFDFAIAGGLGIDITRHLFIQARYIAGMSEFSEKAKLKNQNIQVSLGLKF